MLLQLLLGLELSSTICLRTFAHPTNFAEALRLSLKSSIRKEERNQKAHRGDLCLRRGGGQVFSAPSFLVCGKQIGAMQGCKEILLEGHSNCCSGIAFWTWFMSLRSSSTSEASASFSCFSYCGWASRVHELRGQHVRRVCRSQDFKDPVSFFLAQRLEVRSMGGGPKH